MGEVERMMAAGLTRANAFSVYVWFQTHGNDDGLEDYIQSLEKYMKERTCDYD